jgi:preprotein translocase subunit SecG
MLKNQNNRKYLIITLLVILIVMAGALTIGQILQTEKATGQAMSGNNTSNQTANQTVGGGLKSKVGG